MNWYEQARSDIADIVRETGASVDLDIACAVVAAMSPNQSWKGNLTLFRGWCEGHIRGMRVVLANVARAEQGEALRGLKTDNFRKALQGDDQAVVVDRWMFRAYGMDPAKMSQKRREDAYRACEAQIRADAAQSGKTPREYQADLWIKIRGRAD